MLGGPSADAPPCLSAASPRGVRPRGSLVTCHVSLAGTSPKTPNMTTRAAWERGGVGVCSTLPVSARHRFPFKDGTHVGGFSSLLLCWWANTLGWRAVCARFPPAPDWVWRPRRALGPPALRRSGHCQGPEDEALAHQHATPPRSFHSIMWCRPEWRGTQSPQGWRWLV